MRKSFLSLLHICVRFFTNKNKTAFHWHFGICQFPKMTSILFKLLLQTLFHELHWLPKTAKVVSSGVRPTSRTSVFSSVPFQSKHMTTFSYPTEHASFCCILFIIPIWSLLITVFLWFKQLYFYVIMKGLGWIVADSLISFLRLLNIYFPFNALFSCLGINTIFQIWNIVVRGHRPWAASQEHLG